MNKRTDEKFPTFLSDFRQKFPNIKGKEALDYERAQNIEAMHMEKNIIDLLDESKTLKTGQKIVYDMMDKFKEDHLKKFPFERGLFHQCLPNPKDPKEYITVQLVKT
jgi:hypothetical protein